MSDFEVCPVGTVARLKAAEARCKALETALADRVVSQTMLTNLAMQDGSLYATIEGGAAGLLAAGFAELLHQHPEATNYLEMSFQVGGKPVIVTVQKGDRPTPHTLRREAEGKREALLALVTRFIQLCALGDVDETTEARGWGELIAEAKVAIAQTKGGGNG